MSYSVYIHINKVNGKKYVGVTMKNVQERWKNGKGYGNNPHFTSAIKKYGWDSFDHYVVEVDSAERMYELEKYYIKFYQTTDPEKGYNKSLGGDSGCYMGKNSGTDEYKKDYSEKYRKAHREKNRLYSREYYNTHKEESLEYQRQYRKTHKEEKRLKNKEWRESHKEELKEKKRAYYLLHREEILEKQRKKDIPPITPLW